MDGEGGIVAVLGNGSELDCVWAEVVLTGVDGGCFGCLECDGFCIPSILISVFLHGLSLDALNHGPNCWSSNCNFS